MAKEKIYPYAVARIRSLEKNLLTEKTLMDMADATTVSDCLRTISEVGYEGALEIDPRDFEELLSQERAKAYDTVQELIPEEKFMDVFLCKNDYHNLKVLIKQEICHVDGSHYLIDRGTIPIGKLEQALLERTYMGLPGIMGNAIEEVLGTYSRTGNGQMIDIILDKAAFFQMKETAVATKNDFIIRYVEKLCDLTNLKSFLRIRSMKKNYAAFASVFVKGGTILESVFYSAFGLEDAVSVLRTTDYGTICAEGFAEGFTVFEKLCDDYLMDYMKWAKYKSMTVEPLIAFFYAKEAEIKTVRIILTSKLNKIEPSIIRERVRAAYV